MKKQLLFAVIITLFTISCKNKNTTKVSPYLNFEKGFTQTLVFETKTSASKEMSFEEANEIQFRLDSITPDSSYVFTGKVTRMQYASDMFGEKEGFDTEVVKNLNTTNKMSVAELELYNDVKNYMDEEFIIVIDKRGNLVKNATFKNNVIADPKVSDGYTIAPVIFPDEELYVGYTWDYDKLNPLLASQESKIIYTVADITADKIILDVLMKIGGVGKILEKNEATGTYEIDKKTKQFIKGSREMELQTGTGKVIYSIYTQ